MWYPKSFIVAKIFALSSRSSVVLSYYYTYSSSLFSYPSAVVRCYSYSTSDSFDRIIRVYVSLLLNFCISILVILVVCILLIEVLILLFVVFAVLWCAILFMSYTMVVCVMTYYPSRGTMRHERARLLRTSAVFFFQRPAMDQKDVDMKEASKVFHGPTNASKVVARLRFNAFCICLCFRVFGYVLPTNLWVLLLTTRARLKKALMRPMQFDGRLLSYTVLVFLQ